LCNGQVVPRAPQAETLIEFTHRLTSGVALIAVVALVVWAFRSYPRGHVVRKGAVASLLLILVEAALGAGLVLFRYVADNASAGRAIYLSAHLVNTLLLIGAIALTAWWASAGAGRRLARSLKWRVLMVLALAGTVLIGISGAVAALGDTLFPPASSSGAPQDADTSTHPLVRLRILHPIIAAGISLFLLWITWMVPGTASRALAAFILIQLAGGVLNVLLLAPVWMQMIHLLLGDLMWIALVLMAATVLSRPAADGSAAARL
jgi:cytochrome c oxidase assembly protein subunit 15/protoheme IX farnesyltransferase